MNKEQPIPRTFGGYISKRTNKRVAPTKAEMIMWIRDYKNIRYAMDCPYRVIKKVFIENGGMEWWNKREGK
jgi:hypothetical protein